MKRVLLKQREIYHIFNKSIAGYRIFEDRKDYLRFIQILEYYNYSYPKPGFSRFLESPQNKLLPIKSLLKPHNSQIMKLISWHLMPDHYHIEVKITTEELAYKFLNNIGNSYTRYLNTKRKRKGPLWQSPYKAVALKTNEQVLHVSRYIHLNSTTSGLVQNPQDWEFSSYREYISNEKVLKLFVPDI